MFSNLLFMMIYHYAKWFHPRWLQERAEYLSDANALTMDGRKYVDIKTENITPIGRHPEDILSNLCGNDFCFDDVQCRCMEGFLQSLKYQDEEQQRKVCLMNGTDARQDSNSTWEKSQILWWKGRPIKRQSSEFRRLVRKVYESMYEWSARFRDILMSTEGKELRYNSGQNDSHKSILTDKEFCKILTDLRASNKWAYRIVQYPRMWPNSIGVEEDYI